MRKFYVFLFSLVVFATGIHAQTEKTIDVTDDLTTAIENSVDGDIFILKPGIHVANDRTTIIPHNITIKSEAGMDQTLLYIAQFDVPANGQSFILEGLEITGARVDSASGVELPLDTLNGSDKYVVNLISSSLEPTDGAYNTFEDIVIQSCHLRNFDRSVIRGDRDTYTAKDILIDDCIVHDFRGAGDYGPFRFKSRIKFDNFITTNSTFYDIYCSFYDCQDQTSNQTTYRVENCTFYNWGGKPGGGKYLFDIKNNDLATLIIKSCILGKTNVVDDDPTFVAYGFRFMDEATAEIGFTAMNPDFYIPETKLGYTEANWDKDEYNTTDMDPAWADPENGDFTLPEGSDFLQMSPEGTIIGDPRWDPEYGVGIAHVSAKSSISLYPNPAMDYVNLELDRDAFITVYAITGQKVMHTRLEKGTQQMSIEGLTPGVYFVSSDTGTESVKLLIK